MESEERLFELCRKGDKDAFFKLVEPLLSRVYSTSAAIFAQIIWLRMQYRTR